MSSALTTRGSTHAWRTIRNAYADHLADTGAVTCWRADTKSASPHCRRTIHHGDRWHLGHLHDRALGGTDDHLGYECEPCSAYSGGQLAQRLARYTPSRAL